jgi:hypothetical protein
VAAVVAVQTLLVSCSPKRYLTPGLFKQEEEVAEEVFLMKIIEGKHPW